MRMRGVLVGVAVGTTFAIAAARIRDWWTTWGIDPDEATKALPGDEVVPAPTGVETRGITIDAPPEAVWPWLLQLGYGRAGWYSYDQLDQRGRSADDIVEAWQALAVGDVVPTHPGGGFEVVAMEPGRALVLRSDTALVKAQAEAAKAAASGLETATAGVKASGAMLSRTPQEYAASWAFLLEPLEGGRTRFIERFRVWFGAEQSGAPFVLPLLGFGVFVMMQKQMVGIRERAERLARSGRTADPSAPPVHVSDAVIEPELAATGV
jgi:hypothetical protein